jgi:hypothetical protein
MDKPKKATYNAKRETSTLYFRDFDDSREFYLRGAVTWPDGDSDGFALLGGQNVKGNRVHIFEELEFVTVNDIIQDGQIRYHGLASWLNRAWSKYFAKLYFWEQPQDLHKRFSLQVYRSSSVEPKPGFIEISLSGKDEPRHIVNEYVKAGRLTLDKDSELAKQLEFARLDEGAHLPAVEALGRLLAGLQRFPFVNHHIEEDVY